MELNDKVTQLEDEIKILKNEVQSVLLDLRDSFLNNVNPFNPEAYIAPAPSLSGVKATTEYEVQAPGIQEKQESCPEPVIETAAAAPEHRDDEEIPEIDEIPAYIGIDEDMKIDNLFSDTFTGFKPGSNGSNGSKNREPNATWRPGTGEAVSQPKTRDPIAVQEEKLALNTIENLSQWVEEAVGKLGPERTRTILDITETMGYVNPDLKKILVKFIHPASGGESAKVTTRDYLSTLVRLNDLLGADNRMEIALLFILILCQEYDDR